MLDHFYAVIMAGGGGTRLWPLSRKARPKQMLRLIDERSLFQTSVERVGDLFPCDNIYVVTVADQANELKEHCPDIPAHNYLIEPMPRGTASVVGLAAVAVRRRDPKAVMAILTSDHYIGNEPGFREILSSAYDVAQDGYLVTLGITPSYPAVGYGYIQQGEHLKQYRRFDAYKVLRFKEKPDEDQARQMLASGGHAWNSGMFVWRVDRILEEFERQMPDLYASLMEISENWDSPGQRSTIERVWPGLKEETIDYGIMESASKVAVLPAADLMWSDVGSWDSLFDVLPGDEHGNIVMGGQHIGLDTTESLVYVSEEHRLIVTIGVDDLVVVDTGDVLLVCRKDQAQRVRQIVSQLKKSDDTYV